MGNSPNPLIAGLQSKQALLAKLPEDQQTKIYNFVFNQAVMPKLSQNGNLKPEDIDLARTNFTNSFLKKPAVSSHQYTPEEVATGGEKTLATIGSVGTGVAGATNNILDFFGMQNPTLKGVEGEYNQFHDISPTGAQYGAAVGKAIPQVASWELGSELVPGAPAGSGKLLKGLSWLGKTTAGLTTSLPTESAEERQNPGMHMVRNIIGMSILDSLTHGAFAGGAATVKAAKAAFSKGGVASDPLTNDTILKGSKDLGDIIQGMFPDKWKRIANGEKPASVLTPEELTQSLSALQKRQMQAEANTKAATKVAKVAEKQTAREQAVADKLTQQAASKVRMQAVKDSARAEAKAFAGRLTEYRKATGIVPTEGTADYEALKKGSKVSELLGSKQGQAVATATKMSDQAAADAIATEAPKTAEAVEAVKALTPEKTTVEQIKEHSDAFAADARAKGISEEKIKQLQDSTNAVIEAAKPKVKKAPAYEAFGVKLTPETWTTPEDVVAGKKQALADLQSSAREKAIKLNQGLQQGALTNEQYQAAIKQLGADTLTASNSINKTKTPQIGRVARDRLRNGAKVTERGKAVAASQKETEVSGMSFEDAIAKIDELQKGFKAAGQGAKYEQLVKAAQKQMGDDMDYSELALHLQEEFGKLGKK